jgi:DNA-binding response OmpR family regulator
MQDGKYVVLCVDDDQDILDTLQTILEANDYVCVTASSGEEGLKRFKETAPDFLIVDLMMEEVDAGTHLVKSLKAEGNEAPIYMLSSVGDELNLNVDYKELGLSGVFQKPVDPNTVLATLKAKLPEK